MKQLRNFQLFFLQRSFLVRFSIITFFFIFIFFIWFFFIFDTLSNKISKATQELVTLKNNKILLDKLIQEKFHNAQVLDNLNEQVLQIYPNNLDLKDIISIANSVGLELINFNTENKDTIEKVGDHLVPLSFKGSFHQILDFLIKNIQNKKLFKFYKINIMKFNDNLKLDCIFDTSTRAEPSLSMNGEKHESM